uniref:Ig-like domain-containing protein n=1 Tax=Chrysemys picta bellii TaxID=8478 RepID=A0A8C3HAB2_CHRPI
MATLSHASSVKTSGCMSTPTGNYTSSSLSQFTVTGPDHPVTASLGGEAVLPCHLSPRMSAENMEVGWLRSQNSEVVHLYRDGQDQYGEQMPEYRGRTELLRDDITNGRVFLRIRDIRPSDDGQYKCFFQSSVFYKDALLELQVLESVNCLKGSDTESRGMGRVHIISTRGPLTSVLVCGAGAFPMSLSDQSLVSHTPAGRGLRSLCSSGQESHGEGSRHPSLLCLSWEIVSFSRLVCVKFPNSLRASLHTH